jgi:putative phosphoesterase|tara:strand:- start:350 stop:706 length:357 start_codon:yes stop_codon:yes gene_type:complete
VKIGVLSDTHIPHREKIAGKTIKLFTDVNLILHAGDLVNRAVIKELKIIAKVEVVKGNMDESDSLCPIKKVLNVGKVKIGLTGGYGPPFGIREKIIKELDELDIIVYGHFHKPYNKIE